MQNKRKKLFAVSVLSGLVALNLGLSGCNKGQTTEALISEAKAYQQKGDIKAAIIQLKNAVQKNPEDAQARYLLGTLYNETGDPEPAEKELRKAISLGMSADTVAPALGTSLFSLRQYKEVLKETDPVAAKKPDAELLTLRGNAYLLLGRQAEAKESFSRALREKAGFADAFIGMARHALVLKDIDLATGYAQQAVTSNAQYAPAWFFKGDLYAAQGKVDEALASYDEVLKIKAGDARAHIAKASLEINAGKFDAAKANFDAARKAAPDSLDVVFYQSLLDFHLGKPDVAWESLQQILRVAPDHMPSVVLAAAVQHALGASQQAEQYLQKALAANPANLYASRLLASILLKNGEADRAIIATSIALKATPRDPQLLALAGEAHLKAKDYRKATEYFEKANAIAPQASVLRTALGASRLTQSDSTRAEADIEISADLNPKSSQAGVLLVMNHLQKKKYDKALAAANNLEKAEPDNPVVHNLKGGIYAAKREWGPARASLERAVALQPNYFPPVGNLARLDMQEKKPDAAKKRLEAFLQVDKKSVPAMTALARLAFIQGRKEEVTSWLERASNENPDQVAPALQLAQHYLRTGDKSKAITLTQKLQAAHPNNADVLDVLAQSQLANDDKAGALQSYNKIASLLPDSALAQFRIATIHVRMQDDSSAVNSLKKALALKPDYLDAQLALASVAARKGDHEQILAIARQMQTQEGTSAAGFELEGDMLMAQKKNDAALKAYEQAFSRDKRAPMLIKVHETLKQSGRQGEANARVVRWIKTNPKDTLVRMHIGTSSLLKKENTAAIEQFQAILQQDPNHVPALNNLALAYQQEKDPRALGYAEKAYELAQENPVIMDTLGWMLVEQGNVARGLPLLQKAASSATAALDTRYHLAAALAKSGDSAAARKELNQLLDAGKTFAKMDEAKALRKQLQ